MKLFNLIEHIEQVDSWWSTSSGRYWYHPKSKTLYAIQAGGKENHTTQVYDNPELFGITDDMSEPEQYDYDGPTLYRAMQEGWVRVYIDRRNPQHGSNIEGIWLAGLAATAKELRDNVLGGNSINFAIIKRTGPDHKQGDVFRFTSLDDLDSFIETRRIPSNVTKS